MAYKRIIKMILTLHKVKSMMQITHVVTLAKSLALAAIIILLIETTTASIGGIVLFSAIFSMALAGFGSAVLVFHLLAKCSR